MWHSVIHDASKTGSATAWLIYFLPPKEGQNIFTIFQLYYSERDYRVSGKECHTALRKRVLGLTLPPFLFFKFAIGLLCDCGRITELLCLYLSVYFFFKEWCCPTACTTANWAALCYGLRKRGLVLNLHVPCAVKPECCHPTLQSWVLYFSLKLMLVLSMTSMSLPLFHPVKQCWQ